MEADGFSRADPYRKRETGDVTVLGGLDLTARSAAD